MLSVSHRQIQGKRSQTQNFFCKIKEARVVTDQAASETFPAVPLSIFLRLRRGLRRLRARVCHVQPLLSEEETDRLVMIGFP